MMKVTWKR